MNSLRKIYLENSSVGDPRHFGPDADPTPFFNDYKDAKNYFFHIFFL